MKYETMITPKGIRVMAVLHMVLVFSGMIRISSDLGAMKHLRQLKPMEGSGYPQTLSDAYEAYLRVASTYHMADMLVALILGGLLIGAGVMLFKERQQGRTLSISYAIASIALRCGMTFWYVAVIHPKHVTFLKLLHLANPAAAVAIPIPSTSPWLLGILISSLYPLWVWWYLRKDEVRKSSSQAF